jgi:hypothetical protein
MSPLPLAPLATSTPHPDLATAIVALERVLAVAQALAAARPIDLTGLDQQVGRICAGALDLPPDQGRALRPHLACLLARLDGLRTVLLAAPADDAPPPDG